MFLQSQNIYLQCFQDEIVERFNRKVNVNKRNGDTEFFTYDKNEECKLILKIYLLGLCH